MNLDIKYSGSCNYDYFNNTVHIIGERLKNKEAVYHEILHAISCNNKEDLITIGLKQIYHKHIGEENLEYSFGDGINEGGNTFFTQKFLEKSGDKNLYNTSCVSSYRFCTNIFEGLTRLIGEKNCFDSHFVGGPDYFIKKVREECHRKSDSKIIKLISLLDTYLSISNVLISVGMEHDTKSTYILTNVYKSLMDLFIFKAEKEGKIISFNDIISNYYLTSDDKLCFNKYIKNELKKHFIFRLKNKYENLQKNSEHLDNNLVKKYAFMIFENIKNEEKISRNFLPEKYKCVEFYSKVLTQLYFVDENCYKESFKTIEIQTEFTKMLFDKDYNFMPKNDKKMVETLKGILDISFMLTRTNAEIKDDLLIKALNKSVDFNLFIIQENPNYYIELYPKINDETKYNKVVLKKALNEVFTTKAFRYKILKAMPQKYKENDTIISLFNTDDKLKNEN